MCARGEPPNGAWDIPVEHPCDDRIAFWHPLEQGALVTSTTRIRAWRRSGRPYHHIIDPATGDSTRSDVVAVIAAAPDASWAEGIAKAMIVAGLTEGTALARTTGVHAWCALADGRLMEIAS